MEKLNDSITVLFARTNSIYKNLVYDVYDFERNALSFIGTNPVICHPPCRAWGKLKYFAKPREGEKNLALWSIDLVRKNGGVLEHPRSSSLWNEKGICKNGDVDKFGGFLLSVNQSWFGHQAQKATILYICGIKRSHLPQLELCFNAVEFVVSTSLRSNHPNYRKGISKENREATPLRFAQFLISIAERCAINQDLLIN